MHRHLWTLLLAVALGCGAEPTPALDAPEPTASEPDAEPDAPPAGSIGGEPILPKPVVVGGISNEAVEESIDTHRAEITACYEQARTANPKLAGKVLIKFSIDRDGKPFGVTTRSTSLRHAPTETCVEGVVSGVSFPPLASGQLAVVTYPFVFGAS